MVVLVGDAVHASGIVWMQFDDNRIGVKTRTANKQLYKPGIDNSWTPIHPVSRQFQVGRSQNNQVLRKQFPLQHAAAKTIHRCQGDTLEQVVVDLSSNRKEPHLHYVGLSRVKTLDGLFILNLNEQKIHVSDKVTEQMVVLRSSRAMTMTLKFPHSFSQRLCSIAFLNARSLHKHIDDIKQHHSLMSCDIHMYCETRVTQAEFTQSDMYKIPGFTNYMFEGYRQNNERSHYGLAVYCRFPTLHACRSLSITDNSGTECAILCFTPQAGILVHVACVYSRPSTSAMQMKTAMSSIFKQVQSAYVLDPTVMHYYVIMGDFNTDWYEQSTRELMSQLLPGFIQIVSVPTTDYSSTLDHVYTNIPAASVDCFVNEAYFTDHKPVICIIHQL